MKEHIEVGGCEENITTIKNKQKQIKHTNSNLSLYTSMMMMMMMMMIGIDLTCMGCSDSTFQFHVVEQLHCPWFTVSCYLALGSADLHIIYHHHHHLPFARNQHHTFEQTPKEKHLQTGNFKIVGISF